MYLESYNPLKSEMLRVLNKDGFCDELRRPDLSDEQLDDFYRRMVLARTLDRKMVAMQRQGRLGTYAPIEGQEACQIGMGAALKEGDWFVPSFRESAVLEVMGVPLENIILYWMANEKGGKVPENINVLPASVPVGSHPLHAVGIAWAMKLRKLPVVVGCGFGDGATSEGDFHEAMNFAGVFHVPVVFLCQNNQYAISLPRKRQTASRTIAQKAIAYGFDGVQIDGNDIFVSYGVAREAVEKARSGGGPTLIEAVTYRFGPHTTSDDPKRYRSDEEVATWRPYDPMVRLQKYMERYGLWSPEYDEKVQAEARDTVEDAVAKAEAASPVSPEEIFDYHFAELPPYLVEQKDYLTKILMKGGEPSHG